jgi:NADPH:quinone reductase-like Zn-dependent oxidoreductase
MLAVFTGMVAANVQSVPLEDKDWVAKWAQDAESMINLVQRVRDGRLRTNIGNISALDNAVAAFNSTERRTGKTIIRVRA